MTGFTNRLENPEKRRVEYPGIRMAAKLESGIFWNRNGCGGQNNGIAFWYILNLSLFSVAGNLALAISTYLPNICALGL